MRPATRLGILLLVAATAACTQSAPPAAAVDVAAEESAVRAVSARWLAFEGQRDAAGIAGLFTDDGRLVWTGQEPVVGPAAIEAFLMKDYEANPKQTSTWTTERLLISQAGDMAVEFGNFSNSALGPDGTGSDRGSYVTVFEKTGGTWKVKADASASALPRGPSTM